MEDFDLRKYLSEGRLLKENKPTVDKLKQDILDLIPMNEQDSAQEVRDVMLDIINQIGTVDLFCSNAGIQEFGTLSTTDDAWHKTWQVNVMSHIYAARVLIPHMVDNKDGYFLITVSAAGLLNMPGAMSYATTKHAALGLAENLSIAMPCKLKKIFPSFTMENLESK